MRRDRKAAKAPADPGPLIAAGNQARAQGRWDLAVEHYSAALGIDPANPGVRVQLGHGLKELGRLSEAEAAYRLAAMVRPDDADVYVQIGHVLKLQGQRERAVESYAEAIARNPAFEAARTELIAAGHRNLLPESLYGRSAVADALTYLAAASRSREAAFQGLAEVSIFPVEAYDAFRQTFPIQPPPPAPLNADAVLVVIDARTAHPALIRLTLSSLLDQRRTDWRAIVVGQADVHNHSVASLAEQDGRIAFVKGRVDVMSVAVTFEGSILHCEAGTSFDPWALDWLLAARARTGADFVYCDHDHHTSHWRRGRTFGAPVFQGMPDLWDMAGAPAPPAVLLVGTSRRTVSVEAMEEHAGQSLRRKLLLDAMREGDRVAHVPRLLCSIRVDDLDDLPGVTSGNVAARPRAEQGRSTGEDKPLIRVIIPTRDEPGILKACLDSLWAKAANPERIRVLVVDNRSSEREAVDLLKSLAKHAYTEVRSFDEPFNWARINNVSVADETDDAVLVFANNDLEMLTQDWDLRLIETLDVEGVGAVGVRMLYPDRTVQHAGMVLGVNDRRPVHDGLGRSEQEGGPDNRWRRPRQVAAVTGAFLAVRRGVFDRVGGFDERLAIGYNDVDFCLKVRAEGLGVVYDPAIELIHHESKTRGLQDERAKIDWDDEELTELHARWGGWMMFDPSRNPHWHATHTRPFDGLRDVRRSEVLRHIDLSARHIPWSVDGAMELDSGGGD